MFGEVGVYIYIYRYIRYVEFRVDSLWFALLRGVGFRVYVELRM